MMNIYSVLDDSDEENVVQKKSTGVSGKAAAGKKNKDGGPMTAGAPSAGKGKTAPTAASNDKKNGKGENAAPSNTVPGAKGKDTSRPPKSSAAAVDAAGDDGAAGGGKDNNRGGKPRGKEPHRRSERRPNAAVEGGEGEGGQRRPKREFDRRSGTGRGREIAKGGRGSYGAGNVNQDAMDAEKHPGEAETLLEPRGDAGDVDDVAAAEDAEPMEPEPATFTLDEFMEKRNEARREALELLGGGDKKSNRAANADSDFAGMKSVEAGELDNYMPARNAKNAEMARKDQRSTSKAKVVDVGFKFENNNPYGDRPDRGDRGGGGRGRGGRGGDRGRDRDSGRGAGGRSGGGRGAGRGGAPATVFSNIDFPSL